MNLFILVFISLGTAIGSIFYIKSSFQNFSKNVFNTLLSSGDSPALRGGDGSKVKFLEKNYQTQDPYAVNNNAGDVAGDINVNQSVNQISDMKPTTGSNSNDTSTSGTNDSKLVLNLDKEKSIDFNEETGNLIIKQKNGKKVEIKGFNKLLENKRYVKLPEDVNVNENNEKVETTGEKDKGRNILSKIMLSDGSKLENEMINNILENNSELVEKNGFAQLFEGILLASPNLNLKNKEDIAKAMENVMDAYKLIEGDTKLERQPRNQPGIGNSVRLAHGEDASLPSGAAQGIGGEITVDKLGNPELNANKEIDKDAIENAITVISNYSTVVNNLEAGAKARKKNVKLEQEKSMENAVQLVGEVIKDDPDKLIMLFNKEILSKIIDAMENFEKDKNKNNKKKRGSNRGSYVDYVAARQKLLGQETTEGTGGDGSENVSLPSTIRTNENKVAKGTESPKDKGKEEENDGQQVKEEKNSKTEKA